jgi:hypothetical protein
MNALDTLLFLAAAVVMLFVWLFAVGALIGLAGLVKDAKDALMAVRTAFGARPAAYPSAKAAPVAARPAAQGCRSTYLEPAKVAEEFGAATAQA